MLDGDASRPSMGNKNMAQQMHTHIDSWKFFQSQLPDLGGGLWRSPMDDVQNVIFPNLVFFHLPEYGFCRPLHGSPYAELIQAAPGLI